MFPEDSDVSDHSEDSSEKSEDSESEHIEKAKGHSEDSDESDCSESDHIVKGKDISEKESEDESESDDSGDGKSNNTKAKINDKKGKSMKKNEDISEEESEDESDSESDDSSDDKSEDFDHQWEELRNEAPDTNEITRRIAVCNMDWDRIRAVDLLVCFNSFKPADGHINSVKIYPSEFGLKRMEEEKLKGPPELVEKTLPIGEDDVEDKKGSKYHREKLRQYQISRLKYYYAVVDCDSPETANTLYEQLNGMEYESSSVRYDLRFIPDDVTFDHEPTSVADKLPSDYKPRLFVTSALQQVKVDLTWDETDPKRRDFFQKIFTDIDSVENDIHDYLASASSESEEEVEVADTEADKNLKTKERITKYKELLKSFEEKEKEEDEKFDVEVTWEPALKEKTEEKVKEKIKKNSLNPFEELLLKKKDQKKNKKKEMKKQNQAEDSEDSEENPSESIPDENSQSDKNLAELALISDYKKESGSEDKLQKKKKKNNSDDLHGFVADMNDPRFSAMHTSSLFNMVPSDQHPKKNDGNFGFKRQKGRKFKLSKNHEHHKNTKRAKHH